MPAIGLIREGKIPADNRVALTPSQCRWILKNTGFKIFVQPSPARCFEDSEYERSGAVLQEDLSNCDLLLGIKEVPVNMLLADKTYMFFSHTKKMQPYNQKLMQAMVEKKITLIDYECLEHEDGQRIIGFGFFAGIVGAHNGLMAYGERIGAYKLGRVYKQKDYLELIHTYFGLKLPPVKIAVTGSGRVAHGILEIMNLVDAQEVEPDEYVSKTFSYPVYVHLKGAGLYAHKEKRTYTRDDFHANAQQYECLFLPYAAQTDILMNGVYWDKNIPRLFEADDIKTESFRIQTIADITDDACGSVPVNLGDCPMDDPVYGVDRATFQRTAPYLETSIDVMAVGNLPNELPRDASRFFGEQLIKHVLGDYTKGSRVIEKATILKQGKLTPGFAYLSGYAEIRTVN
ncbi:NAD(P)-dependent oxidoreductase [Parafilimonas sp.]|uniref:NAD(P)-dependent oxidoreductase n=1 Tax=Parafilimonas sp. TaxID=1969739 RepID=UPI0039E2981C